MQFDKPSRRQLLAAPFLLPALSLPHRLSAQAVRPPLKFSVIGDWGRNGGAHQIEVADMMARFAGDSSFIVSTGDNFYTFGVESVNDPLWQTSFQNIYYRHPPLVRPWFPVLGNHDYGGNVVAQIDRRHIDENWQMRGRWYDVSGAEFGRPDVHLYFIDTVVWLGGESPIFAISGAHVPAGFQAAQAAWLARRLRSDAPIKLVFGHHPIYSVGPHGGHFRLSTLDDALRAGGVTAYINGHDHCLYDISHRGMNYICSGGGSEEKANQPRCPVEPRCAADQPRIHHYTPRAGFAAFTIGGDNVDFTLHSRDGTSGTRRMPVPARTAAGLIARQRTLA